MWRLSSIRQRTSRQVQRRKGFRPECEAVEARTLLSGLGSPSFSVTNLSATQATLTWNSVAGAAGYYIVDEINGAWTVLSSAGSGSNSFTINGLSPGTTYGFDVGASDWNSVSWGNPQFATTPYSGPPAPL